MIQLKSLLESFWKSLEKAGPRTKQPQLVREWIQESLSAYFNQPGIITEMPPLEFTQFLDHEDYAHNLQERFYNNNNIKQFHWHTPSELFKPFYGQAIYNYMNKHFSHPNKIYEIGPGLGGLCSSILHLLPKTGEYHLLEVSKYLHLKQKEKFTHDNRVHCHLGLNQQSASECTLVLCEVLDNLPHDLIRFEPDGRISQATVVTNDTATFSSIPGRLYFEFTPVTDSLITEYLHHFPVEINYLDNWKVGLFSTLTRFVPEFINPASCRFIPTGAYSLMKQLSRSFHHASLLIADFHTLPDAISLGKETAPVVQTVSQGETINCSKLLLFPPGRFDILFPVNFVLLSSMIKHFWPHAQLGVFKQTHFCQQNADLVGTRCKNGFNPMIHTFQNVSLLTAAAKRKS